MDKYQKLIEALSNYVVQTGDDKLAAFLAGYLGEDWQQQPEKPAGVDETLFDAFAVVAGALDTSTINQVLGELQGWTGPEITAARQALAYRRHMR